MTQPLEVCASCHRHVKRSRDLCPFCGATGHASLAPTSTPSTIGRVARAAALSLTAAAALTDCDPNVAPPYGTPPVRLDVPPGSDVRACTLIGCNAPLTVAFDRDSGWTAGTYRVVVAPNTSAAQTCTISIPLHCDVSPRCDGAWEWTIATSGCALDASQHTITGVVFRNPAAPGRVLVNAYQDERLIGMGEFSPEYVTSHPNGPDCEPTCQNAPTAHLTVSR